MPYFFLIAAIALRFIPHMPNFAPIAALALFGGVYFNKKYALILPIAAMLISDYFIGFYNPWLMAAVYGSFLIVGLIGLWLKNHKTFANVLGGSMFGSIIFFIVTNFTMWAIQPMMAVPMYQTSWQGIINCFSMALPFFRSTIAGDLFYTGLMFGLMEVVLYIVNKYPAKKESHVANIN